MYSLINDVTGISTFKDQKTCLSSKFTRMHSLNYAFSVLELEDMPVLKSGN